MPSFYQPHPRCSKVQLGEPLGYPPQNKTRLSLPIVKDEMTWSPLQQMLQLQDRLVEVDVQLDEDSEEWAG